MPKYDKRRAWAEARELVAEHKTSLAIGLALMVVNRLSGFVLPWTSKFLIDDIIGKHRTELLMPLAGLAVVATVIQAATSFALSQVVSVDAHRAARVRRHDDHRLQAPAPTIPRPRRSQRRGHRATH